MDSHAITKLVRSLRPLAEVDTLFNNEGLETNSYRFADMIHTIERVSASLSAADIKYVVFPKMTIEAIHLLRDNRASSAVINSMFAIARESDRDYPEFKLSEAALANSQGFLPSLIEQGFYPNRHTPTVLTKEFMIVGASGAFLYDSESLDAFDAVTGYAGDGVEAKFEKIGGISRMQMRTRYVNPDNITKEDRAVFAIENVFSVFSEVAREQKTPQEGAEILNRSVAPKVIALTGP